jgi:UDP-glucose 4-epimerase
MTKVLITGGCGFIGSNLTEYLFGKTDWDINILDNLSSGSLNDVKQFIENGTRVKFVKGDIVNQDDISEVIKDCDYVINLAAQTSVLNSIENPFIDENINVRGILNLLSFSKDHNIKRFVQASSGAVLGEQEMPINELKIPKPSSPYGASKAAGESYCSAFSNSYGLSCIILRFSNVYGPKSYNKGSVIPKFIKRIFMEKELEVYGDGEQTRDFIHVNDICNGIYSSMVTKIKKFEIIQLGTGIETSINNLINELLKLAEDFSLNKPKIKNVNPKPGEIISNYCNISKAKELLNFKVNISLEKGLFDTFKWFKEFHK